MFYGITGAKTYASESADPDHGLWPYMKDHSLAVLIVYFFLALDHFLTGFDLTTYYF